MTEPLRRDESARVASPPVAADRALPTPDESAQQRAGTDPRESLGRIVHDVRRSYSEGLDRPFIPAPWEERTGPQRELDMRIGEAVAVAERDRIRALAAASTAVCHGGEVDYPFTDLLGPCHG